MVQTTRLREALLSTVAVGALLIAASGLAQAQVIPPAAPCNNVSGTVVTCSGNVSPGVQTTAPYTVLNVNNLTTGIAPAAGRVGIFFSSSGAITINSDTTGTTGIVTTSRGIFAANSGNGSVTVMSSGSSISTNAYSGWGISVEKYGGTGAITITSSGSIISTTGYNSQAIFARNRGGGAATITSSSDISTTNHGSFGIQTITYGSGAGTITSSGSISTAGLQAHGIVAIGGSGPVTVTLSGSILTTGNSAEGIYARATTGNIAVNITGGSITSSKSYGITAQSSGAITVTTSGTVQGQVGIQTAVGTANITNTGTITGTGGTAIQFGGSGNTLTIAPTSVINGNVVGTGSDKFQLGGSGIGSFDASLIGPAQQYRGFSTFNKIDTSTWTLTGTNTLALPWTVQQGTLNVTGTLANSPFTVNNGGTLGGTGTVGDVNVASGGTFAPGPLGTPGAITVAGNLAFQPGALYLVQTAATASIANVSGSATLTGGSVQATGTFITNSYDILHATGGFGGTTFSGLTVSNPNFSGSLSYTPTVAPTDVFLNLTAILGAGSGLSGNQQNVAGALNSFFNNGGTLPPGFVNVFGLTGGNLANALSQLSGEAATGAQQGAFQLTSQFLGIMLDPFVDGRGGIGCGPALGFAPEREALPEDVALAYAKAMNAPVYKAAPLPCQQRWAVWAGGYGGYNHTNGDPAVVGSHDLSARTFGGAVGLDYHFSPDTIAGIALAGGATSWGLAQGLGGGRSDAFQAGAYAATRWGPAYLAGALAFTNHWMSTDRFAAFGDHLTADFDAQSFGGRLEGGYRLAMPWFGFTPYAALQAQSFRTPAYSETDLTGGGFALNYNARTRADTRSELGARFDHAALVSPDAALILRGRLAWAHDWITDPTLAPVFQALPGASFIVNGAAPAEDSALVSAGAELRLTNGITLLGKFDGEFASHSQTYAGTGTLRFSW
jgi:uncharacterized protein with beta-barrel porin domain